MPSILRSIVLSTLGTISLVLALLWAIGDERFVPSLSNPHLLTSAGILLLTNTGLFIIFKKEFLKKRRNLQFSRELNNHFWIEVDQKERGHEGSTDKHS